MADAFNGFDFGPQIAVAFIHTVRGWPHWASVYIVGDRLVLDMGNPIRPGDKAQPGLVDQLLASDVPLTSELRLAIRTARKPGRVGRPRGKTAIPLNAQMETGRFMAERRADGIKYESVVSEAATRFGITKRQAKDCLSVYRDVQDA